VCAPDDGWKYHPIHVEQFPEINKLCNDASCWKCTGIYLTMHGPLKVKFVFHILPETFLILRRLQRYISINVYGSSCKVRVILIISYGNFNLTDIFSKTLQISSFMKICPVGAEFFHADGRTNERTDTTNLTPLFAIFLPRLPLVLLYKLGYYCILLKKYLSDSF